jgi:hypothetical protein
MNDWWVDRTSSALARSALVSGMGLTAALGCADESGDRPDDGSLGDQEEAAGEDEFGGAGAVVLKTRRGRS